MENKVAIAFDCIRTPEEWKNELLDTKPKKFARFGLRAAVATVLAVAILFASTVTVLAAAAPPFREWLLSVINVTGDVTEVDGKANIVRTSDLGNEYLVRDGFVITHEGTSDQQVFAYMDDSLRNMESKLFQGVHEGDGGSIRYSFQYVKNGANLYTYDHRGDVDFGVDAVGNTNTTAVYLHIPSGGRLFLVDLENPRSIRDIEIPGKLKSYTFSDDGKHVLFKLQGTEDGVFDWSVTDLRSNRNRVIPVQGRPYDADYYDNESVVLMDYNEDQEEYRPTLYNASTGETKPLDPVSGAYTVTGWFTGWFYYSSRPENGEYVFKNMVDGHEVAFPASDYSEKDMAATSMEDRFFFRIHKSGEMTILDLQNGTMTELNAGTFNSDGMSFVSLMDDNTLLVCGEKDGRDSPEFYLVKLQTEVN
jgi:hypothetical protein